MELCARFGNPRTLVTDNGAQFKSTEFQKFCSHRSISHLFSPPFHPQSNGQASTRQKRRQNPRQSLSKSHFLRGPGDKSSRRVDWTSTQARNRIGETPYFEGRCHSLTMVLDIFLSFVIIDIVLRVLMKGEA